MADKFEPYGEFDHVVAVPLEQAIANFKMHLRITADENRKTSEEIRSKVSTVESRKAQMEIYLKRKEEAELCLFRSIEAHNETSIRCGFVKEDSKYHPVYEITGRCEPSNIVYLQSPTKRYKYVLEQGK